jgi:hypothetical protein
MDKIIHHMFMKNTMKSLAFTQEEWSEIACMVETLTLKAEKETLEEAPTMASHLAIACQLCLHEVMDKIENRVMLAAPWSSKSKKHSINLTQIQEHILLYTVSSTQFIRPIHESLKDVIVNILQNKPTK